MQIEAVLFDLFDTLVLLEKNEAYYIPSLRSLYEFLVTNGFNASFEDFKSTYFDVRDKLNTETEKTLEEPHFNVRVSRVLQQLGYNLDVSNPTVVGATKAFTDEFIHYVSLDPDAINVLKTLQAKYKLGLVSNFAIPEGAWRLIDKFSLREFFDAVLVSGAINRRKPSPEIFRKALEKMDVNASKAVFVGDMVDLDVKGAKNAGMKSVLIQRRPLEEFGNVKPDSIINDLRELLRVLADFNARQ